MKSSLLSALFAFVFAASIAHAQVPNFGSPNVPNSVGGGSSAIVANSTLTTGFTAGQLVMSDGTKAQVGTDVKATSLALGGVALGANTLYAGGLSQFDHVGVGAAPYSSAAAYFNNSASTGVIIKAGSASNTRTPFIIQQSDGQIKTAISAAGGYYTNAFMNINGAWTATLDANGGIATFVNTGTSGISTMLEIDSDVDGPSFITKSNSTSNSYHWAALDNSLNFEFAVGRAGQLSWGSGSATLGGQDLFLGRANSATFQVGAADTDLSSSIAAQNILTQGALTGGTANQAGKNFTIGVSPGKGTGTGGSFIVQVAPAGSTGSTRNALVTALTIASTKDATFAGTINGGGNIIASANVQSGNGNGFTWSNGSSLKSSASGTFVLANNGATAGVGWDVTTDSTLKIQNRALNAYGTIDVLGLKASGVAGASCGPLSAVTSLTVVNGIVTACGGT